MTTKKLHTLLFILLLILPNLVLGFDSFTIICTGSVHGEIDPCG